ncbi:YnbE family lipoprotein [Pseudescherichia vulneris]|uniref:YnbE family lipoprotein n=1 Tax=Pseudescherichia vulneris TaxID=566 RepID=UPI003018EB16
MRTLNASVGLLFLLMLNGCTPRIEVAAPKEPITINMNVKIEHDINIKADKEVEALLKEQN